MYQALLSTHSILRYLVLIFLVAVIIKSFLGFIGKKPYGKVDNMLGLTLFSATHTQLLVGLILYFFASPFVQFSGMKDPVIRYWTAEHSVIMLAAVVLITLARTTSKKMTDGTAKHRRMFIFNTIAMIFILEAIIMSKRGIV